MASFMDLSSSPDPLGDDVPSSVRPVTRRTVRNLQSHPPSSALSVPASMASSRGRSAAKSPRKQTFELDVGNERSPQRLLVTVEADDERGRSSGVNRRLFTASPTRSVSRRRETMTQTTTVPLRGLTDDEGATLGDGSTARKRGRPRGSLGSKNGTPAPRGKKRAGTPLRKNASAKRHSGETQSEAVSANNTLLETDGNIDHDPTPKPKAKTRKTPRKTNTPAASSTKPTGRKRGRPRKALMPDEVAMLTSEVGNVPGEVDVALNESAPTLEEIPSEGVTQVAERDSTPEDQFSAGKRDVPMQSATQEDAMRSSHDRTERRRSEDDALTSEPFEGASTHEARVEENDAPMMDNDMFSPGASYSDGDSEAGDNDGATYSGQDNMTHASDFSMIAVNTLPSFHASLHSNQNGIIEEEHEYAEAGDETNFIINQTLESLRRSTQSESQGQLEKEPKRFAQTDGARTGSSPAKLGSSQFSWTRSPRRQKEVPLNRQVFGAKAPHVDDSFSSIPDSVLHAATPGRLPMKSSAEVTAEDNADYDDSFSEIPEEILVAATPKAPNRSASYPELQEAHSDSPISDEDIPSASRSTNIGSDRLPTPDDTNSSTTDAKNGFGEDIQGSVAESSVALNTSDLNIRSSPPIMNRQASTTNMQSEASQPTISRQLHTMDIQSELSQANQEEGNTPQPSSPSPQLPQTHSGSAGQPKLLERPVPVARPSLSPIVRAGRTLQSVMTDRSSPEGRESSLGSPFKGSPRNGSRRSSVAISPTRETHISNNHSHSQSTANRSGSFSQSIRSLFPTSNQQSSAPIVGQIEDPFGPDMPDYSQTEALRRSAYGTEHDTTNKRPEAEAFYPSLTSSTRAAPPSAGPETSSVNNQSSPATERSRRMSTSLRSANTSLHGTRGSLDSRLDDFDNADQEGVMVEADPENASEEGGQAEDAYEEVDRESNAEEDEEIAGEPHETPEVDEMDLWDVEASRPTPRSIKVLRAEAQTRKQEQIRVERPMPETAAVSVPANNAFPARRIKIPSPWRRGNRRLIYQDDFRSPSEIEMEDSPPSDVEQGVMIPPMDTAQQDTSKQSEDYDDDISRQLEEEIRDDDSYEFVDAEEQEEAQEYSQGSEITDNIPAEDASGLQDFSMASQYDKNTKSAQDRAAQGRRGFLGGFDILSFFSSPRAPPNKTQGDATPMHQTTARTLPKAIQSIEKPGADEPQSALRAPGLFPSIRQKSFNPSPERRNDLFSPGAALRSNDTVPDTYADSPSTPERQDFPTIPQKQNFTPLSGQSRNTASLFTPSQRESSPAQEVRTPSPENDSPQEPSDSREESSELTEESSFERIPPREKPSNWDKTLSPTKSCMRSPLKPKTPGRVVEFTSSVLSPHVQAQMREERQRVMNTLNRGDQQAQLQGPLFPAPSAGMSRQEQEQDKENTPSPERQNVGTLNRPRIMPVPPPKPLLSPTTWTRTHWLRLDALLCMRQYDPDRFKTMYPESLIEGTGRKHPLAGKEVCTDRARLSLEAWHLEVIEAFRSEAPDPKSKLFDAKDLSKRVFALIIGREDRRLGKVGKGKENAVGDEAVASRG